MGRNFPHINDTNFPDVDGVNVYQYANDFDYKRYDYSQMSLQLCTVPWDMGEAHVGNRTISGIGNVVYFSSKDERDLWFDNIPDSECFRWETKMRELHRTNTIDVPVPFDVASRFNYLVVRYRLFANDDSPVEYENSDGLKEWFWFVREVEFMAPNTTRLHLLNDAWQTFIYDLDVSNMILERGHAPMAAIDAEHYLANPIANCANLLHEDVANTNSYDNVVKTDALIFNDENTVAVIVTTANPVSGNWGSKANSDWQTPARRHDTPQGYPSYTAFAIDPASLSAFLNTIDADYPQFAQTIQCVFFASTSIVYLGDSYTFAGYTVHAVGDAYTSKTVTRLSKDDFAYNSRYANIAKLYTWPYAYLSICDESGDETIIRVEQTDGSITFDLCANLVYPWLAIDGHCSSIGRATRRNLAFKAVTTRTMPIGGNWNTLLMRWKIPTFGIVQDARANNDFATYFDRAQAAIAYTNAYNNVVEMADCTVDNAALQVACNNSVNSANNTCISTQTAAQVTFNTDTTAAGWQFTSACANSSIAAQDQQAAIAASAAGASAGVSAVSSLASLDIGGAIGAAVQGGISAGSITAQNQVAVNLEAAQAGHTGIYNVQMAGDSNNLANSNANAQIANNNATTAAHNSLTSGTAANSAAAQIANGGRDRNTAINAVSNRVAQTALNAPLQFGDFANGETCATRPMGIFTNIITQDDNSIAQAGNEFLRYGYMFNQRWEFNGDWNVCERFTYWKLSDFWVTGLNIPDMYVDKIRFFLFGGVTVWRKPEFIGHTSIYENGFSDD